jgi:hypothetical protein
MVLGKMWFAIGEEMNSRLCMIAAFIIGGLISVRAAKANLLINGSFESGTYNLGSDGGVDLGAGSTAITGWTVITNDVAPIGTPNNYSISAEDGTISLDLQSYNDSYPYGGVTQTIATIPGSPYDLTFWIGVQSFGSPSPNSVIASAGATSQSFTNSLVGPGEVWEQFGLPFTATSTSTTISLSGSSTASGIYIGLDNAGVVAVPEPASLGALALGGLGLLARRRRV